MRMSRLFGRTLREPPADVQLPGLRFAVRAALLRPSRGGQYAWLPLGVAVLRRIEGSLRRAAETVDGQEIRLPASVWREGGEEKEVIDLARREIRSYRDLPRLLYAFECRETGPYRGPWRLREVRGFKMIGLHPGQAEPDRSRERLLKAVRGVFACCDLEVVEAEAGGDGSALAFLFPHSAGGAELIRCPSCGYAATAEAAHFRLAPVSPQPLEEMRPISTPDCPTIADVAAFVGVPAEQTLKAVFYTWEQGDERTLVFVVIRGDLEVSEAKLLHLLGDGRLRAATDEEIRAAGAEPGFASPVGLTVRERIEGPGTLVIGDPSIQAGANFVAGANREGYHLTGVNYPRDFAVTLLADVGRVRAGHPCPRCEKPLAVEPAMELGRFRPPSRAVGAVYLDAKGREQAVEVEICEIDLVQMMAAVVEAHHDEHGILWPPALAPFDVHLVLLGRREEVRRAAEEVYGDLRRGGFSVLYDDRNESAGVKFADADLIGCPVRVTVSRRSVEAGGAELKPRWADERQMVSLEALSESVSFLLDKWPGL